MPLRFPPPLLFPLLEAAVPAMGPVPGLVAAEGVEEAEVSLPPDLALGPLRIHSGPNCIEVAILSEGSVVAEMLLEVRWRACS